MSNTFVVQEILSDAEAYLDIGDARNAVEVLFEGIDQCKEDSVATRSICSMLSDICFSFWATRNFEEGKEITTIVVNEMLRRTRTSVEPEYVDLYATALVATGTSLFPIQRVFRHRNLVRLFSAVADRVGGDVVECGCLRGLSLLQLCLTFSRNHPNWTGEGFHGFDSFEGLSEPAEQDLRYERTDANAAKLAANMIRGRFAVSREIITENVHRLFPRVSFIPGRIPTGFAGQPRRVYRFVHIDVDLYQPTFDSLRYFFPRLAEGGMIITDDYGWPGARKAFQEYCLEHQLELLTTDTSQAFLIKGSRPQT